MLKMWVSFWNYYQSPNHVLAFVNRYDQWSHKRNTVTPHCPCRPTKCPQHLLQRSGRPSGANISWVSKALMVRTRGESPTKLMEIWFTSIVLHFSSNSRKTDKVTRTKSHSFWHAFKFLFEMVRVSGTQSLELHWIQPDQFHEGKQHGCK